MNMTHNIWYEIMNMTHNIDIITKLPESGDLCGNITEFGVAEGDPSPPQTKWYYHRDRQTNVVLYCFYILLFNAISS